MRQLLVLLVAAFLAMPLQGQPALQQYQAARQAQMRAAAFRAAQQKAMERALLRAWCEGKPSLFVVPPARQKKRC